MLSIASLCDSSASIIFTSTAFILRGRFVVPPRYEPAKRARSEPLDHAEHHPDPDHSDRPRRHIAHLRRDCENPEHKPDGSAPKGKTGERHLIKTTPVFRQQEQSGEQNSTDKA